MGDSGKNSQINEKLKESVQCSVPVKCLGEGPWEVTFYSENVQPVHSFTLRRNNAEYLEVSWGVQVNGLQELCKTSLRADEVVLDPSQQPVKLEYRDSLLLELEIDQSLKTSKEYLAAKVSVTPPTLKTDLLLFKDYNHSDFISVFLNMLKCRVPKVYELLGPPRTLRGVCTHNRAVPDTYNCSCRAIAKYVCDSCQTSHNKNTICCMSTTLPGNFKGKLKCTGGLKLFEITKNQILFTGCIQKNFENCFLQFLYTDDISSTTDIDGLEFLLNFGQQFDLPRLADLSVKHLVLKLSDSTALQLHHVAVDNNIDVLRTAVLSYMDVPSRRQAVLTSLVSDPPKPETCQDFIKEFGLADKVIEGLKDNCFRSVEHLEFDLGYMTKAKALALSLKSILDENH